MTTSTEATRPDRPTGDPVDQLLVEAFQAKQGGLPELALESFSRASQAEPDDYEILVEVAKCQVECALHDEALRTLKRVPEGSVHDPELNMELARTFRLAGDVDAALECFRKVKQKSEHYPQATLEIVMLLERQHRLEEADDFLRNRRGNPNEPTRQLATALLADRTGDLEKAIRGYRRAWRSKRGGCSIEAGYRLARVLDRAEKSEEAMRVLASCKKVERTEMPTAAIEAFVHRRRAYDREMLEQIPPDWFDRVPKTGSGRSVLVLGHPRSGTSLYSRLLSRNPHTQWIDESPGFDVLARQEVMRNPSSDERPAELLQTLLKIAGEDPSRFPRRYRRRLLASRYLSAEDTNNMIIDKNPGLSTSLPTLACLLPDTPWFMLLRDPRDVAISCYFQRLGPTPLGVSCLTLDGAMAAVSHVLSYWMRIRTMLPDSRCMEIRYEQLVEESKRVLERANHFLGIRAPGECPDRREDSPLLESPTYADILKPVHRQAIGRWRQHQPTLWSSPSAELIGLLEEFGYPVD